MRCAYQPSLFALFLIVFLNCYSTIRLLSRKCETKLSISTFFTVTLTLTFDFLTVLLLYILS